MNAISLHQPYASAMGLNLKTIETRSWRPPESCVGERFVIASTKRRPDYITMKRLVADDRTAWNAWWAAGRSAPGPALVSNDGETDCLPLGCIVASGVLTAAVPILSQAEIDYNRNSEEPAYPAVTDEHGELLLWHLDDPDVHDCTGCDIEPERAWGDFAPGRWAWLFSGLAPTTKRCPWCWGEGKYGVWPGIELDHAIPCPVCEGKGSTDPIPVRGRQRVWHWTPEKVR